MARRDARHARIRSRVSGTAERPRLAVFKSNTALYAQLVDDTKGVTLLAADTRKLAGDKLVDRATALGTELAKAAKAKGVEKVVFDRGGFLYRGAITAMAEAAREGGLQF